MPVLAISGLQDRVFFNAADVDELAQRLPHCARMDMADAGHMIPVERPVNLGTALLAFAARVH